jgi:hypothetical protein
VFALDANRIPRRLQPASQGKRREEGTHQLLRKSRKYTVFMILFRE